MLKYKKLKCFVWSTPAAAFYWDSHRKNSKPFSDSHNKILSCNYCQHMIAFKRRDDCVIKISSTGSATKQWAIGIPMKMVPLLTRNKIETEGDFDELALRNRSITYCIFRLEKAA